MLPPRSAMCFHMDRGASKGVRDARSGSDDLELRRPAGAVGRIRALPAPKVSVARGHQPERTNESPLQQNPPSRVGSTPQRCGNSVGKAVSGGDIRGPEQNSGASQHKRPGLPAPGLRWTHRLRLTNASSASFSTSSWALNGDSDSSMRIIEIEATLETETPHRTISVISRRRLDCPSMQ